MSKHDDYGKNSETRTQDPAPRGEGIEERAPRPSAVERLGLKLQIDPISQRLLSVNMAEDDTWDETLEGGQADWAEFQSAIEDAHSRMLTTETADPLASRKPDRSSTP